MEYTTVRLKTPCLALTFKVLWVWLLSPFMTLSLSILPFIHWVSSTETVFLSLGTPFLYSLTWWSYAERTLLSDIIVDVSFFSFRTLFKIISLKSPSLNTLWPKYPLSVSTYQSGNGRCFWCLHSINVRRFKLGCKLIFFPKDFFKAISLVYVLHI